MQGLVHIYCGDGKGKTTAAVGLAVRAAGAGKRVLFTQFFKDGSSSEVDVLKHIPGVTVQVSTEKHGFFFRMDEAGKQRAREDFSALLESVLETARAGCDLLILDEAVSCCNHGVIDETRLLDFLKSRPDGLEVVITGRDPSDALLEQADYVTEMRKLRHPYDKGIAARKGIEY